MTKLTYLDLSLLKHLGGSLSAVSDMTGMTFLNLFGAESVGGSLASLERLVNLKTIFLYGLKQLGGSVKVVENFLDFDTLLVSGTSVTGRPSEDIISRCKDPDVYCMFTPAPKMCGEGERMVGLTCESCPNCGADGSCLHGMDESDYFCESCYTGDFKVGQTCTECFAGDATVLLFPAVILTGFAFVAAVLYRLSKKYPAVATQLKNCTFNIENQIRVKQVSTFFQVMGIVASLGMPLPSWFRLSFENLIVFVTWPFSFQPACIELIDVRTSTRGLLLFVLTMCFTYGLRRLYHIKLLRQCLPLSLFKNAQVAAGIIFSVSSIMLLTSTLRTTELKDGIFHLQGDTNAALMAEIYSLVMETCMQVCFMVTEATIIHSQLKNWGRRYKELEKYHREGDEGVKRRMETVEYQLENEMYFIATFCQNYVPANVDFERKIFGLKITSFLVSEMTIAASAAVHMLSSIPARFSPFPVPDLGSIPAVTAGIQVVLLNIIYARFLKVLRQRPYISGRFSDIRGDPLNDAESFRLRAISFGLTMLSIESWDAEEKHEVL
ncbi:hypothetical protein TrRE_jg8496, partial [Triparma retinervis]